MIKYNKTGKIWNDTARPTASDFNIIEDGIKANCDNVSSFPDLSNIDESRMPNIAINKSSIDNSIIKHKNYLDSEFILDVPLEEYSKYPDKKLFYEIGKLKKSVTDKTISDSDPRIKAVYELEKLLSKIRSYENIYIMAFAKGKYLGMVDNMEWSYYDRSIFPSWATGGKLTVTRTDSRMELVYEIRGNMPKSIGSTSIGKFPFRYGPHTNVSASIKACENVFGGTYRSSSVLKNGDITITPLSSDRYKYIRLECKTNTVRCIPLKNLEVLDVYNLKKV